MICFSPLETIKNASNVIEHTSQSVSISDHSNSVTSSANHRVTNPSSENISKDENVSNLSTVLGSNDIMPTNPGVSATLLDVRKVDI